MSTTKCHLSCNFEFMRVAIIETRQTPFKYVHTSSQTKSFLKKNLQKKKLFQEEKNLKKKKKNCFKPVNVVAINLWFKVSVAYCKIFGGESILPKQKTLKNFKLKQTSFAIIKLFEGADQFYQNGIFFIINNSVRLLHDFEVHSTEIENNLCAKKLLQKS